jgi:hypothetical protein
MVTFEKSEAYAVTFEITVNKKVSYQYIEAPRIVIEEEFKRLVNQAARSREPIKVKMSRNVFIYDPFENQMIERENSIVFTNKAWNERN